MDRKQRFEEGVQALLRNGHRLTEQRKRMLDFFVQAKRPLSAMEIYEKIEKKFRGMSYGTVYQNIKLYQKLQLIEALLHGNEIRYRLLDHKQPQFQFICLDCKRTIGVDFDPKQTALPLPERFQSKNYKLDVFGYCTDCCDPTDSVSSE